MTIDEIKLLAENQYKLTGGLIPVPVVDVAKKLGLSIYEIEMPNVNNNTPSGVLTKLDSGDWAIVLNEKEKHTRKRFTIAHEIGHFLIHKDIPFIDDFVSGEIFYRGGNGEPQQEKDANFFAANLLMPEEKVKEVWKTGVTPTDMAIKFDVSEVSMIFRLKNLGLIGDDTVA